MFKKKVAILTLVSVISSFSANTTAVLAHELTKNEEKISTQENSADNNEESKTAQNLETSQEEEKVSDGISRWSWGGRYTGEFDR